MARTKRKVNPLVPVAEQAAPLPRIYNVGGYVRLSVEDSGKKDPDTIEVQQEWIEHYIAAQPDMNLCHLYRDNGRTGTNFQRPGFERLMEDVRAGKIDCIVVKDDCVIKARTPQPLENRHFLRISAKFRAILRPQRTAHIIGNS